MNHSSPTASIPSAGYTPKLKPEGIHTMRGNSRPGNMTFSRRIASAMFASVWFRNCSSPEVLSMASSMGFIACMN